MSHDVGDMGKKVSDLVLYFSSSLAYSEIAEVWPIYRRRIVPSKVSDLVLCFNSSSAYSEAVKEWPICTRRIVPSNDLLMWLVYCKRKAGRIHSTGPRLHIVSTIGKKLTKLVFILYFEFQLP